MPVRPPFSLSGPPNEVDGALLQAGPVGDVWLPAADYRAGRRAHPPFPQAELTRGREQAGAD